MTGSDMRHKPATVLLSNDVHHFPSPQHSDPSLPFPHPLPSSTDPSSSPTMNSFRNHRVIIASLFLPNTAILGESHPSTPELAPISTPAPFPSFKMSDSSLKMPRPALPHRPTGPLKSIVEDLKDKVRSHHVLFISDLCQFLM